MTTLFDKSKAEDLIVNRGEMSLPWVSGFHQGDGGFYFINGRETRYPCWCITQYEEEVLERVSSVLGIGKVYRTPTAVRGGFLSDHEFSYELKTSKCEDVIQVLNQLSPFLVGNKRDQACSLSSVLCVGESIDTVPMSADFAVGFWEADGWLSRETRTCVHFCQKDPEVLECIRDFLRSIFNKGSISKAKDNEYRLGLTDTNGEIRKLFLDRAQSLRRRAELVVSLMIDGVL